MCRAAFHFTYEYCIVLSSTAHCCIVL